MIPGETIQSQKSMGMPTNPHHGEFKILHTNGGYYIGTMFVACGERDCGVCSEYIHGDRILTKGQELDYNSRETDYFKTQEEADAALKIYKETGELPNERF